MKIAENTQEIGLGCRTHQDKANEAMKIQCRKSTPGACTSASAGRRADGAFAAAMCRIVRKFMLLAARDRKCKCHLRAAVAISTAKSYPARGCDANDGVHMTLCCFPTFQYYCARGRRHMGPVLISAAGA